MTRSFFREARLCIVWGGGGESGSFITNVFQALGMESREREFRVCVDISMVGSIFFTVGAVSNICCFPNSMH